MSISPRKASQSDYCHLTAAKVSLNGKKQKKQRLHTIKPCVSLRCDTPTCWIRSSFSLVDAVFRKERSGKYSSAAAAQYVWNTYKNEPQYVQQKDIIHFYCHFCSCDADWTPPRWSMTDRAKNVLWGVVHFETGSYTMVPAVLSDFFSYRDVRQACTDFHGYSKLRQIRLFKNGRMDIRFASSELAEQFIDIYLSAAYS